MKLAGLAALLMAALVSGCAADASRKPATAPARENTAGARAGTAADPDLLVTVEMRAYRVAVSAGQRFTIADADGVVLGQDLTQAEFRTRLPQVYEAWQGSFAGASARLDARRD